jgi:hypothetical protein
MLLLTGVTVWSHCRQSAVVRPESLAIPSCLAGLEACRRLYWFLTCRGGAVVATADLRDELRVAAAASLIAMAAPLFLGAILRATCPRGVAASLSRRWLWSVAAAMASVALIWFLYDLILRGYLPPS